VTAYTLSLAFARKELGLAAPTGRPSQTHSEVATPKFSSANDLLRSVAVVRGDPEPQVCLSRFPARSGPSPTGHWL